MSSQHPIIGYEVALSHRDDILHQAETRRLAGAAEADRWSPSDNVKRFAGQALVRLGERLQRSHHRPDGAELAAAAGALHLSR